MCLPDELKQYFSSYFPEKGSLKSTSPLETSEALKLYSLLHSILETLQAEYSNELYFAIDCDLTLDLSLKLCEKVLTTTETDRIKNLYCKLYPNYEINHFTLLVQKSNNAVLYGNRLTKNSIFTATRSANSSDHFSKQVCRVNYFIRHSVVMINIRQLKDVIFFVMFLGMKSTVNMTGLELLQLSVKLRLKMNAIMITFHCAFCTLPLQFEGSVTETVLIPIPLPSPMYV